MFFTKKWQLLFEQLQQKNEEYEALLSAKEQKIGELQTLLEEQNDRLLRVEENMRNVNSSLEQNTIKVNRHIDEMEAQTSDLENLRVNIRNNNIQIEKCLTQTKEYKDAVNRVTFEAAKNDTGNANAYGSIDYFDFENHFRGDRENVKNNQRSYVKYFEGCQRVVDIGCGRGEFLELLTENGIGAVGVDTYKEFVDFCKEQGLDAVEQDAVEYLLNCDEVDGIFAGQLVEHLKVEQIIAICRIAYDRLKPGACLIMETPNPRAVSTYTNAFYLDPSHMKPVHPLFLEYVAKKAGFSRVEILLTKESRVHELGIIPELELDNKEKTEQFNQVMREITELLFGSQDYAIVATK